MLSIALEERNIMKHIVVVGGGFGGVVAARQLSGNSSFRITLISDQATFRYSAALYRVATGYRRRIALMPISEMLSSNVTFVMGTAQTIDRTHKRITLSGGDVIEYDKLVLSLGSVTTYFDIPGLSELSYGIKNEYALQALREHFHSSLIQQHGLDTNYIVVGGGPTGVELAAGLASYLRFLAKSHHVKRRAVHLELVEASQRILPTLSERASLEATKRLKKLHVKVMVNKKVEAETALSLKLDDLTLRSKTVIWTAGTTNNPFYEANKLQFKLSKRGRVIVDQFLRVDKDVYVIGDNADTTYSGLAQTAIHQAKYVSKSITTELKGRTVKPYHTKRPFYIVPVGSGWSVLEYGPFVVCGWLSAQLRKAADLVGYADVLGWQKSLQTWKQYNDSEEDCPVCKRQ